jgi:uncharacterized protein (TIRG00374 family)
MKKRTLLTIAQYVIFLGLGILIIYRMTTGMSEQDKADMMESIRQTKLWLLAPVLVAGFLSHWLRALRWKLLLKPLDIHPSTTNTTLSVLIGYLVNLLLPRMGEVAKCTVLARYEHVPADKMVGTILAERAFDVFCLVLVTLAAFALQADVIGDYASSIFGKLAAKRVFFIGALTAFAFLILFLIFLVRRHKQSKIVQFIIGMKDGVSSILKMKDRGRFLFYTICIWTLYWSQVILGFWSIPATEHLGMLSGLVVLIFGSVGMIVTPGGLGAYPALIAEILFFYGIDDADGKAFGWVSWAAQTGIVLILGVIALIILPLYNRNKHPHPHHDHEQARVDTE